MLALAAAVLLLTSPDLRASAPVPKAFVYGGCGGANRTPRLRWSGVPAGARALALTVHDPDAPHAGGWTHWLVYAIPPRTTSLGAVLPPGAIAGRNDFGAARYDGPCPPPGPAHRYVFRLDALDAPLPLSADTPYERYQRLRRGHVLASGVLQAVYGIKVGATAIVYAEVRSIPAMPNISLRSGELATCQAHLPYGDRRATIRDPWGNMWQIATYQGTYDPTAP